MASAYSSPRRKFRRARSATFAALAFIAARIARRTFAGYGASYRESNSSLVRNPRPTSRTMATSMPSAEVPLITPATIIDSFVPELRCTDKWQCGLFRNPESLNGRGLFQPDLFGEFPERAPKPVQRLLRWWWSSAARQPCFLLQRHHPDGFLGDLRGETAVALGSRQHRFIATPGLFRVVADGEQVGAGL